jgi:DNA-binding response OmpR family regulator
VLIIDDEAPIVRTLTRALARDADVTAVSTIADGLAVAHAEPFTLILCDWNLPGATGRDLIDDLQRTRARAVAPGRDHERWSDRAPRPGVRVVAKPVQLARLRELLDAA